MALKTFANIADEILIRNNINDYDGYVDTIVMGGWLEDAHTWAASFHKWPFTEGRISTTFTSGRGENSDEWYFEAVKADSIRFITIGGKIFKKLHFQDYRLMRELSPEADDRVYSDFGRVVFVNPRADASGTLTVFCQYQPEVSGWSYNADTTNYDLSTSMTIFSEFDEEGNEAIVEKVSGYLKRRMNKIQEAELHDKRAELKLEEVWKRVLDEQAMYQTHPDRGGMFERFDVLAGRTTDEISSDQF